MTTKVRLDAENRDFFALITHAVLSNPFLDERDELLIRIIPGYAKENKGRMSELATIVTALNDRMDALEKKGRLRIQHFKGEDRQLLRDAFLLQVYRRFVEEFDTLIQSQLTLGDIPAQVPFAEQIISQLKSRGFSIEECLHYLALFYQFRRAFHFIDNALVGDSPPMKKLRHALWNNIFTTDARTYDQLLWNRMEDFSTLLLGETGTGKGSAAAAIGRSGFIPFDQKKGRFAHSFTETFLTINLSQYPESLIESELFGHRKGAFTGAIDNHRGLFSLCKANGSLFLDEIGDITIPVQIKLLQVLQDRTFTPVGSHDLKRFPGRVIAATNRSIDALRKHGNFRDDFFYRLCSDVIFVPTLRQRIEESASELEQMVNLLLGRITGQENPKQADMIIETLKRDLPSGYTWPGNVRELEQAIRRILLTRHYYGDFIEKRSSMEGDLVQKIHFGKIMVKELVSQYCSILYNRLGTYEEVARCTGLDRRTVKKYLQESDSE